MVMKSNILLIYTGGTIGMMENPSSGELEPLKFEYIHEQIPEIQRLDIAVIPVSLSQPLDSSQMHPSHWIELVEIIRFHYTRVDGFVVLHGTDTLAFTASALSFMIQNLQKPIILTGSQLPVGVLRSDGKENLLAALEIAHKKNHKNQPQLREVAVFFQSKLFRGNRVSKISTNQFDAFASPNHPLLGFAGVEIEIDQVHSLPFPPKKTVFYPRLALNIGLIKLYPGMHLPSYSSVFNVLNHSAVVIEAFGSGNTSNDPSFRAVISKYVREGGVLVTVSQCTSGSVIPGKYAAGQLLMQLGAWNGKNLTTEAAVTKLMWLFGNQSKPTKALFEKTLCGESD